MTTGERRRWLALVLTLTLGLGGAVAIALWRVERQGVEQQRDLCDLARAFIPTAAPAPSASYGAEQLAAGKRYLVRRC